MIPCKMIDLRGWRRVHIEFWNYNEFFPNGKVKVYRERNPNKKSKIRERMIIRVFQKRFGREIMTVRSIHFFNSLYPSIQLWRNVSHPELEDDFEFDFFRMKEQYWWQNQFYRSVRFGDKWYRLENRERLECFTFKKYKGKIIGVFLRVINQENPDQVKTFLIT